MEGSIARQNIRRYIIAIFTLCIMAAASPLALAADIPKELIPVGKTVGINISCDGVIVVSLSEVDTAEGTASPALDAGFAPGDVITQVNSDKISSLQDFRDAIDKTPGEAMTVRILRDSSEMQLTLTPVTNKEGSSELGLWLRDGMAGIGTVTFYDPRSGVYGALGHSVSDIETGTIMPLEAGTIMPASITSIIKGESGAPGELQGDFNFDTTIGTITTNSDAGIFGVLEDNNIANDIDALPVGSEKDITLGEATIMANIDGEEIKEYSVEISRIFSGGDNRKMMVTVTDDDLLAATGGIVQGMSGSPIIQNGKIVGAVTHVLINNPEKGYGISIDTMLSSAYKSDEDDSKTDDKTADDDAA